jgi:hypothetical protein
VLDEFSKLFQRFLVPSATMLKPKIEILKLDVKVENGFNEIGMSYIEKVYNENFNKFS